MKVFLSFASPDRRTAQRIQLALLGGQQQVFFDDASLPSGGDCNTRIRKAIEAGSVTILEQSSDIAAEVAAKIDQMAPTTDDFLGRWSWIDDDGIEFIITFRSDGTFIALSETGADRLVFLIHNLNGTWNITDARLSVTQTHYSFHGFAREHPLKWIDSVVARATGTEIRLKGGMRLKRVASP